MICVVQITESVMSDVRGPTLSSFFAGTVSTIVILSNMHRYTTVSCVSQSGKSARADVSERERNSSDFFLWRSTYLEWKLPLVRTLPSTVLGGSLPSPSPHQAYFCSTPLSHDFMLDLNLGNPSSRRNSWEAVQGRRRNDN